MAGDYAKGPYWLAVHRLSDLVVRRNDLLMELESMATLPLSLSPAGGMVGKFDTRKARAMLDRLDEIARQIDSVMAEVRKEAEPAGQMPIEWVDMPERRKTGFSPM